CNLAKVEVAGSNPVSRSTNYFQAKPSLAFFLSMPKNNRQLPFSPQAGIDELLEQVKARYPVHFEPLTIGDIRLHILQIRDMEAYIENLAAAARSEEGLELPFWAKIWPTSILLSHILASSHDLNRLEILEIGAGVGVCGLVAASQGALVVMTDYHPDALLFARINVLQNSLQDRVKLASVDFTTDLMDHRFDRIIGSEVLYREESYTPLVDFLENHLVSGGEVLLAKSHIFQAFRFFELIENRFAVQERTLGYKEQNPESGKPERHLCNILRMKRKKDINTHQNRPEQI
ncbi:MAG: class I SAM-dependent methyltransferase, partial [Desulfovermiculus sp.]